ncbi:unnamed protein product, partial [Symbiodinium sp. CCMP2456]
MHGGQRKKDTRLRATPRVFHGLQAECDGSHEHLPYGYRWSAGAWTFDTAAEAQYPRLLCQRLVKAASEAVSPALLRDTTARFRLDSLAATVMHFVPRVAFTSMAVFADFYGPEHVDKHNDHSYLNVIIPLSSFRQGGVAVGGQVLPVASGPCLLQSALPHRVLPAVGQRVTLVGRQIYANSHNPDGQAWGVYYSGEEHVQEALKLTHPADSAGSVPDNIRRAVFDIATLGPSAVAELRRKAVEDIEARAARLGPSGGHPITKDKCLALFRELVNETEFPDQDVCQFMEEGVSLVGVEPSSALFPS